MNEGIVKEIEKIIVGREERLESLHREKEIVLRGRSESEAKLGIPGFYNRCPILLDTEISDNIASIKYLKKKIRAIKEKSFEYLSVDEAMYCPV